MVSRDSDTSLTLTDASQFPNSGTFFLERTEEILTRMLTSTENTIVSKKFNTRLVSKLDRYEYTSRTALSTTGDIVEGQNQISNLASTIGLAIGQEVSMVGVPKYAKVVSIAGPIVTLNANATATSTGTAVSFLGSQLTGISPNLPTLSSLNEISLSSLSRTSNVVTATTPAPHDYQVGEPVIIYGSDGILTLSTTGNYTLNSNLVTSLASVSGLAPGMLVVSPGFPSGTKVVSVSGFTATMSNNATSTLVGGSLNFREDLNGGFIITSTTSNTFTYDLIGTNGIAGTSGSSRVERFGFSNNGSKVYVTDAIKEDVSRIKGPYVWDQAAPFVLSSMSGVTTQQIQAGKIVRLLNLGTNDIPSEGGYVIFNYGLSNQEGPVRYLYKPTSDTIAIDPSYTFKYNHSIGSVMTLIGTKGPHAMSTRGDEYPPYITDPSEARVILQELIRSVKSAGIFVNFLVRYPEQLYATLDVYQSGNDPG
jgi:hypothetical protein